MTRAGVRVVFMGSPEFAVPALEALAASGCTIVAVYTQPDRPSGRGRRLVAPPVKVAAERIGLPVLQPERLRGAAVEQLRALAPDLVVVAAFGQILRPDVLLLPLHGCLNVHASLLPRHRGASPIAAILAGDVNTGVSIMQIDAGLDTGPVVAQREVPIRPDDTSSTLGERLSILGAELLMDVLPDWLAGSSVAGPQDAAQATYAPQLRKEEARIDWTKPAERLWREVRAFNPWPLSHADIGLELVQVLEAVAVFASADAESDEPGTVISIAPATLPPQLKPRAGFGVVTGNGVLVPLTLRRPGKKSVSGAEFARGMRDLIGRRLVVSDS